MWDPELLKIIEIERELVQMRKVIASFKTGVGVKKSENVLRLLEEREKLKSRLAYINKRLEEESRTHPEFIPYGGDNVNIKIEKIIPLQKHIREFLTNAIHAAYPHLDEQNAIVEALDPRQAFECGDFECINAPLIAELFKTLNNSKCTPKDVGQAILAKSGMSPCIAKLELLDSGHIQIFLDQQYIVQAMKTLLNGDIWPSCVWRKRVVVQFSSLNIAEEMSVCDLRSTILGESISRLLKFFNHDVVRESLVADWGIHAGILITYLAQKFPNFMKQLPKIPDLPAFFRQAKERYLNDSNFMHRAHKFNVLLHKDDSKAKHAWKIVSDMSGKYFKGIYTRLNITVTEQRESSHQFRIQETLDYLKSQKLLYMRDGQQIMNIKDKDREITVILEDSNGVPTDIATKVAVVRQRIEEQKADWLLYVTDYDQNSQFEKTFLICKTAKFMSPSNNRTDQALVTGELKGDIGGQSHDFKLISLLDQSLKLALEKLKKKGYTKLLKSRDLNAAQQSLAYGSFKYAFLRHNDDDHDFVLAFDQMFDENFKVVLFMFNTYARMSDILCNRKGTHENAEAKLKLALKEKETYFIARQLFTFYDLLSDISTDFLMHKLCTYCQNLCEEFTKFYKSAEKEEHGILFCSLVLNVLTICFDILGLKPVKYLFKDE